MPPPTGGRPRKEEGSKNTRQVRVYADLAQMIADIIDAQGGSTAALVDPLVRPRLEELHSALRPEIERIRAAKATLRRIKDEIAGGRHAADSPGHPPPESGPDP